MLLRKITPLALVHVLCLVYLGSEVVLRGKPHEGLYSLPSIA